VQLLKHAGATVTAVCATDHMALVEDLGADRVIDYTAEDFTAHGQRYDAVLDAVGKTTFARCARLLRSNGIYISTDLGPLGQNPILALVTRLLPGKTVKFPIPTHDQDMIRFIQDLMASHSFRPVIDRRYPFDQIVEAYRYVETGQKVGNVVITVASPDDQPT
jgi:NADPH:quinone reductase-like Zn-dependent oxidoreductase